MKKEAADEADETREQMMLQMGEHMKMAQVQRALHQQYVAKSVLDCVEDMPHSERAYTFVVDYGQNMELPVYN